MTGACFSSEQERLNAYMSVSNALLAAGQSFYNYGDTKPAVSLQGYPWFRTTDTRWYFFQGVWKSATNYSTQERKLYVGALGDLPMWDGGDTGTPSSVSGPMWVEDEEFRGRSPMGPGAIPSANPAKTLSVDENYGEGAHIQTLQEMARHTHGPDTNLADSILGHAVTPGQWNVQAGGDTINMGTIGYAGGATDGSAVAMPIIHPVRGIYIVKWSGRQFYTVP